MRNAITFAGAALTSAMLLSGPAESQGTMQTVGIEKVEAHDVSAGYRASKLIGSSVLNDADEPIGSIDDILVSSDGKDPFAVISVGGFLGMGARLIIVRYDSLTIVDNKVVLTGGTKDGLKALPEFSYETN